MILFEIRTPLVRMTKKETLELANRLGILSYLLEETIIRYEGMQGYGCRRCPACLLRNQGIEEFYKEMSDFHCPDFRL